MVKVLLVDDEFLVCSYLRQLIDWESQGYRIVGQASNGRQAVEKIRELNPDLVFLDVHMPEMDGIDLIRLLHEQHPQTKVIILSSYSNYHYVRETMKSGAVDYLLKHELTAEGLRRILDHLGGGGGGGFFVYTPVYRCRGGGDKRRVFFVPRGP
ncbi:MAG: response regulator, partial [Treponema sp.]|nr:response regulator [Treponema sp.]